MKKGELGVHSIPPLVFVSFCSDRLTRGSSSCGFRRWLRTLLSKMTWPAWIGLDFSRRNCFWMVLVSQEGFRTLRGRIRGDENSFRRVPGGGIGEQESIRKFQEEGLVEEESFIKFHNVSQRGD